MAKRKTPAQHIASKTTSSGTNGSTASGRWVSRDDLAAAARRTSQAAAKRLQKD